MTEPTAPTKDTGLYFIGGYLFGDPGGLTQDTIVIKPADKVSFAARKPANGRSKLVQRFGDSAVAAGGKVVGYTTAGTKDKVEVTGLTLTLETEAYPAYLKKAKRAQVHAFITACIEVEGSTDGKLIDDPSKNHVTAFSQVCADAGIGNNVSGTGFCTAWVCSDATCQQLQDYPFLTWGRCPTHTVKPGPCGAVAPTPPTKPPAAAKVKAYSVGLITRNGKPLPPGAATVVTVQLGDLAPSGTTFNASVLTKALDAAKATGAASVSLRVEGGTLESDANKKAYGSVALVDPQGLTPPHTTVAMWKPEYQAHIKDLLPKIAGVVEDDPFVRELYYFWGGCEYSAEWTIKEAANKPNRDAWLKAGFDADVDMANNLAVASMYAKAGFAKTRMAVFTSIWYQHLYSDGTMKPDKVFTAKMLDTITTLLPNVVLGINNADLASYGSGRPEIYALMLGYAQKGFARHDQTCTAAKMGGTAGCVKFFAPANLAKMVADQVYTTEPPRGWGLTDAQTAAAQKYLLDAYAKAHP